MYVAHPKSGVSFRRGSLVALEMRYLKLAEVSRSGTSTVRPEWCSRRYEMVRSRYTVVVVVVCLSRKVG
jgi:hypothetical protein